MHPLYRPAQDQVLLGRGVFGEGLPDDALGLTALHPGRPVEHRLTRLKIPGARRKAVRRVDWYPVTTQDVLFHPPGSSIEIHGREQRSRRLRHLFKRGVVVVTRGVVARVISSGRLVSLNKILRRIAEDEFVERLPKSVPLQVVQIEMGLGPPR